ncbi:cytohesin-1-like isoform 1 protein [Lasius niger]|uniref:Cytohesin-1-like isoform 1 protein n=2 Tax=Apocrita TaxID=7400 RepID=A0A0J7KTE1_LASNI|nr:cytohesin-1-like isoform 1 protein [Lasius niger]
MTLLKEQLKDELGEVVAEMEAMEGGGLTADETKPSNKAKQTSIGRKKFNMDPKKGIEYLIEHNLLAPTPEDVAQFLYKGEGLNKTAIGDYLGERHDFNERVLRAFVELHDFTDLILVQALRQFLWSFRLPGEAQKIDRMMECFAQRYCQLNPNIFTNTDTCYVLSFAIIMLNTSLHNPSVKDKPSVEQFISMNRGINNGGDLPRELLVSLYESIKTEPFKIPEDDGNDLMHTFFNPDKEGWLWKQGGRYKSWKRRWFILNDNCLYYFEYTTDKEPRGIIPLENIQVREIQDRHKPHCFELYAAGSEFIKACKTDSEGKVVEGIVKRKVLVLDLDETLIHSHHDGVARPTVRPGTPPDFVLKVTIDRHPVRFFVHKRPHVDFFLDIVSQWYELVVFTASMEIYGAAVADKLDNNRGILRRRYYRQHCTPEMGSYTKDLSAICSDLSSVFILDNSPGAYRAYPPKRKRGYESDESS